MSSAASKKFSFYTNHALRENVASSEDIYFGGPYQCFRHKILCGRAYESIQSSYKKYLLSNYSTLDKQMVKLSLARFI